MASRPSKAKSKSALKRFIAQPLADGDIAAILAEFDEEHNDRGVAIIGAAFVERVLLDRLMLTFRPLTIDDRTRLFEGENAPLGTLSAKTKAAYALGICTRKERNEIDCIRVIRNAFAHSLRSVNFQTKEVVNMCAHLSLLPELPPERKYPDKMPPRMHYIGTCIELIGRYVVHQQEYQRQALAWALKLKDD